MITCPNCGASVREGQRFCGNCAADVQAAAQQGARTGAPNPPGYPPASSQASSPHEPLQENETIPYAYDQPSEYGYEPQSPRAEPPPGRALIIGAAIFVAILCAFSCGILFGFEIIPTLLGVGAPAVPTKVPVTPVPASWMPMLRLLI